MKRRKVNLKLDKEKEKKTHTQCTPKRHAVELCVEEQLNTSSSLTDSTLDLTVTYDYKMPAYVASGPLKSNKEIVQLFTIEESPHRQPKKMLSSLTTISESRDSPTKKRPRRMKGKGTSVSPEDLRRFEELAHQLVECKGPLDLEDESPGRDIGGDHIRGVQKGTPQTVQHRIEECHLTSLSGDEEFENLFTSEELSTLDSLMRSAERLSPIHVPPPPPLPPSMQSLSIPSCPATYLAPPTKYLATPPTYLAPQLNDDSDDDRNFWTDAADMLDSSALEEAVVKSSTAAPHLVDSPVTVVLADCSNVPLWSSSSSQPCSQEDIAHKRNKALEKLKARKRCKQKAA